MNKFFNKKNVIMFSLLFVINVFCGENEKTYFSLFNLILTKAMNIGENEIKNIASELNIETEGKNIDQIKSSIFEKIKDELKCINGKNGKSGILELAKYLMIQTEGKSEDIIFGEICEKLKGIDGNPGKDGKDGKDGTNGKDGQPGINGKDADPKDLDMIKKVLYYGVAPVTGIITLYILFKEFLSKNNNVEQEN